MKSKIKNSLMGLKSKTKDLFLVTAIESRSIISWGNLVFVFAVLLISILPILFGGSIESQAAKRIASIPQNSNTNLLSETIKSISGEYISRIISSIALYSIVNRIRLVLNDNSTIDKNRAEFMSFNKGYVTFAKVFSDITIFIIPILLCGIIGPFIISNGLHGIFSSYQWGKLFLNIIGITFVYLLASIGMRLIWTSTFDKKIKIIVLSLWMLFTIGWMVIGSIVFGVYIGQEQSATAEKNVTNFVKSAKYAFAFLPLFGCLTPWLVFYGTLPEWTIIPQIIYTLIFAILIWGKLSSWTKQFLCI